MLLSLFFIGCSSDSTDDLTTEPPTLVTYKKNVKSIIDKSCATSGCHNANSNAGGLTLEKYKQVKHAVVDKDAIGRMESTENPMPPVGGNLPANTILTIKNWRDQGYVD